MKLNKLAILSTTAFSSTRSLVFTAIVLSLSVFLTTGSAFSATKVKLIKQPALITLGNRSLSAFEYNNVGPGFEEALIDSQYVELNVDALSIIKGLKTSIAGQDGSKEAITDVVNVKNTQIAGQDILIQLPGNPQPVTLLAETVQNLIKGEDIVTFTGRVAGMNESFFVISLSANAVIGKINLGKYIYLITTSKIQPDQFIVSKLEKAFMQVDTGIDVLRNEGTVELVSPTLQSSNPVKVPPKMQGGGQGTGRVNVLFYYAQDVYNSSLLVSQTVAEMNAALARSTVSSTNYIASAAIVGVSTTFQNQCKREIIDDEMVAKHGVFSNIDKDMDAVGADIAFLLLGDYSATGCFPGQTYRVGGIAYGFLPAKPYAISTAGFALADLTALHEIGHVLGGSHSNIYGNPIYARGITEASVPWQSIMGGYDTPPCVFTGLPSNCERIHYFSTPALTYNGNPLGTGDRDMVLWLDLFGMPIVSGWHGNALPPPPSPNPITSVSEQCYGLNSIIWTAQATATEYQLYKSTSSNFSYPALVYSGSNTNVFINVSSGTWYLRAKACHIAGCGAFSNQVTATYFNGCS